jgi:hypothetical protein
VKIQIQEIDCAESKDPEDAIADDADSGSFTEGAIASACICIEPVDGRAALRST